MKHYPLVWKDWPEFCERCNIQHRFIICPECEKELWDIRYPDRINAVRCPECHTTYAILFGKDSLYECVYLDIESGCTYPGLPNIHRKCKECPFTKP